MQMLMFPDPRPLVERLGPEFFRQLPSSPGVYLMRDAKDTVLYVGKAKNLRQRLNAYRVANPDRMARRHLRLLRAVVRIELELCPDEQSALTRESELLRTLKPRFNRAGTWQGPPRFFLWRSMGEQLELAVTGNPEEDWRTVGPLGGGAFQLRAVLVRLLWFATHPERGLAEMPCGWAHGRFEERTVVHCGSKTPQTASFVERLLAGENVFFCEWLRAHMPAELHPFHLAVLEADLEFLSQPGFQRLLKRAAISASNDGGSK
jgi:excinuclease UvrABC nuclease subunit